MSQNVIKEYILFVSFYLKILRRTGGLIYIIGIFILLFLLANIFSYSPVDKVMLLFSFIGLMPIMNADRLIKIQSFYKCVGIDHIIINSSKVTIVFVLYLPVIMVLGVDYLDVGWGKVLASYVLSHQAMLVFTFVRFRKIINYSIGLFLFIPLLISSSIDAKTFIFSLFVLQFIFIILIKYNNARLK